MDSRVVVQFFCCLILLMASSRFAYAINCAKAKTPTEISICNSPALIEIDQDLELAYRTVRETATPDLLFNLRKSQIVWIQSRDRICAAAADCIIDMTRERIEFLTAMVQKNANEKMIGTYNNNLTLGIPVQKKFNRKSCHLLMCIR